MLNTGAGESSDEVKQQRIAALSAWKTKPVSKKLRDEEAPESKVKARLCLRGERTNGCLVRTFIARGRRRGFEWLVGVLSQPGEVLLVEEQAR